MDANYRQGCRWLALATALATSGAAWACGPFFPTEILRATDDELMSAPAADFALEVSRLTPPAPPSISAVIARTEYGYPNDYDLPTFSRETANADVLDLRDLLAESGVTGSRAAQLMENLRAFRQSITSYAAELAKWESTARYAQTPPPKPVFTARDAATLNGLPAEFVLYEQGALAWHGHQSDRAVAAWQQILQLPDKQRQYRSVWAAYMLGRAFSETDPAKARKYFATCRELATRGYHDRTGLAAASIGWDGYTWLREKRYDAAIAAYLRQLAAGDSRAVTSLRDCASAALQLPDPELRELVRDGQSRQVLVACLLSHGGLYGSDATLEETPRKTTPKRLLRAVEAAGVRETAGADRLAWLAYQDGDIVAAARWLKLSPTNSAIVTYLQAKLALRSGDLESAGRLLAQAARAFPVTEQWDLAIETPGETYRPAAWAAGELAVLKLRRSQYVDSLDLLLRNGWWTDAAYVAERVLTADELMAYVDRNWPRTTKPVRNDQNNNGDGLPRKDVRYLLGRRLVRLGRWKEARQYMPDDVLPKLDAYVEAIRVGHRKDRTPAERAAGLWQAARVARYSGMQIMGTALAPDFADYGGAFDLGDPDTWRKAQSKGWRLNVPSVDEQARLRKPPAEPMKRYHYRYIAAEHGWAAAELMPDGTDDTARVLAEAGTWLKNTDPKLADRFYKSLVRRCGATSLGRQAATMHWFPPLDDQPKAPTAQSH